MATKYQQPFGIYYILNVVNGKIYIGSTIQNFKHRWNTHVGKLRLGIGVNKHFQSAWFKYGEENFEFGILEELKERDKKIAIIREDFWIHWYESNKPEFGYNKREVAESCFGIKKTEEEKKIFTEKIRKIRKENPEKFIVSEETRAKIGAKHKGKKIKPEAIEKARNTVICNGSSRGENNSAAKITLEIANEIRAKYIPYKYSYGILSKEYGISAPVIAKIISHKLWKTDEDLLGIKPKDKFADRQNRLCAPERDCEYRIRLLNLDEQYKYVTRYKKEKKIILISFELATEIRNKFKEDSSRGVYARLSKEYGFPLGTIRKIIIQKIWVNDQTRDNQGE